jgi:transposase
VHDRRVLNGIVCVLRSGAPWRDLPDDFGPYPYRARNLVERSFNRIKHYCRIITRYDKVAAYYLAFIQLA